MLKSCVVLPCFCPTCTFAEMKTCSRETTWSSSKLRLFDLLLGEMTGFYTQLLWPPAALWVWQAVCKAMVESGPFGQGLEEVQRFQSCRPASAGDDLHKRRNTDSSLKPLWSRKRLFEKLSEGRNDVFFFHQCWAPCSVFIIELLKVIESPESWQVPTWMRVSWHDSMIPMIPDILDWHIVLKDFYKIIYCNISLYYCNLLFSLLYQTF